MKTGFKHGDLIVLRYAHSSTVEYYERSGNEWLRHKWKFLKHDVVGFVINVFASNNDLIPNIEYTNDRIEYEVFVFYEGKSRRIAVNGKLLKRVNKRR